jgi:HK97 gp10 family phage protein
MDLGFGFEMTSTGFAELAAKLERGAVALGRPGEERMVRAGAEVARAEMVRRAPVLDEKNAGSDALEPGAYKRGIRVLVPKDSDPVEARVGPRGRKLIRIATDVEYGHREVHKSGAVSADVPAHPVVRPTYESTQRGVEEAMIAELDKTVVGELA